MRPEALPLPTRAVPAAGRAPVFGRAVYGAMVLPLLVAAVPVLLLLLAMEALAGGRERARTVDLQGVTLPAQGAPDAGQGAPASHGHPC